MTGASPRDNARVGWCFVRSFALQLISPFTIPWLVCLPVMAQSVSFDGSLGTNQTLSEPNYRIQQTEGRSIGNNLFHSFRQFNLNTGESVTFESTPNIRNIFSRVTGGTRSEIDGLIETQSGVNLFLLNPSGILFGPNARLNVGGSFVASTADAIGFGTQGFFSATEVNEPSPLLSIEPSAFWFNQVPKGDIVSQSIAASPLGDPFLGLHVPNGEYLTLLGGNVNIASQEGFYAGLHAFNGRVTIGAVGGVGAIGLNPDGSLDFPDTVARADVVFNNRAFVNVSPNGGGDIGVTARNIDLLNESVLLSGISEGEQYPLVQSGDISLNATGAIRLTQFSRILNSVESNSSGNAGSINIVAGSLSLTDGSRLAAATLGQGDAGSIFVTVRDAIWGSEHIGTKSGKEKRRA